MKPGKKLFVAPTEPENLGAPRQQSNQQINRVRANHDIAGEVLPQP
jgi:hypothetical protein